MYYAPEDVVDRNLMMERLVANICNMGVQGEFGCHLFLKHIRVAIPSAALMEKNTAPVATDAPRTPYGSGLNRICLGCGRNPVRDAEKSCEKGFAPQASGQFDASSAHCLFGEVQRPVHIDGAAQVGSDSNFEAKPRRIHRREMYAEIRS